MVKRRKFGLSTARTESRQRDQETLRCPDLDSAHSVLSMEVRQRLQKAPETLGQAARLQGYWRQSRC
jgi:hypothetical protein